MGTLLNLLDVTVILTFGNHIGNRGTRGNPIMEYYDVEVICVERIYQPLILNQTAHKSDFDHCPTACPSDMI